MAKRRSKASIEKEVDKIQDKIEKQQLKDIQKDYRKNVPAFIWVLKILIGLGIIGAVANLFLGLGLVLTIKNLILLAVSIILLFGIIGRKRWSYYLGLVFFIINAIFTGFYRGWIYVPFMVLIIALFFWHRDYLNQK